MAARGGVSVRVGLDYADKGAIKRATRDLQKLGKQSKVTAFAFKKSQLAYTAAGAALYKVVKDSTRAIIEEEKSIKTLSNALRTVGLQSATSQVEGFITSLESLAAVADDRLRPAFARIVSQIKDVAASQELLQLATEISAATGKDLDTVVTALTRAYAGQRKGLMSLGVGMDATYLKTASLEDIIVALNDKFSGSNQAMLDSYSGRVQRLSVAFGTMKEGIGKGLLDAFEMLFGGFDTGTSKIAEFGTTIGDFFRGLAVLWTKVRDNPIIKFLTRGLNIMPISTVLKSVVELGKEARLQADKLREDDKRENRRSIMEGGKNQIANAVRVAKTVTTINKKVPAPGAGTGLTAEDRLKMQFDIERIGLAAALRKETDEATKNRLEALMKLNTAAYDSEAANITNITSLIRGLTAAQEGFTAAVGASANAYVNLQSVVAAAARANQLIQTGQPSSILQGAGIASGALGDLSNALSQFQQTIPQGTAAAAAPAAGPIYVTINESANPADTLDAINRALRGGARQVVGL